MNAVDTFVIACLALVCMVIGFFWLWDKAMNGLWWGLKRLNRWVIGPTPEERATGAEEAYQQYLHGRCTKNRLSRTFKKILHKK